MRVLVVTNMYPTPEDHSCGTFVHEQVEAVRQMGIDIDVLYINGRASRLNYFTGIVRFWGRLVRRRYDLIHAHYVHSGVIARLQIGTPILVTSHGSDTKGGEGRILRRLVRHVDAFTVTSADNQTRLGAAGGSIIPCGVNMELFAPMPQDEARKRLGLPTDTKIILYVGRDHPVKRLDLIEEAVRLLRARRSDIELVKAIGVDHEQVPVYVNAADVLVLASESEGSPVVIKEAMACNLPIVSTDVGDVREVISGTDGCYVCDRTAQSIADHLGRALDFGCRTTGREDIRHLSTSAIAERLLELYNVIAKSGSKR